MSKNASNFMQVVGPPDVCARHGNDHMAVMLNQKSGGFWAGGVCVTEATEPAYVCVACIQAGAHACAPIPTEVEDRLRQVKAALGTVEIGQRNAADLLDLLEEALRVRASGVALNGQEYHDVSGVALDAAEKTWEPPMVREVAAVGKTTRVNVLCPACSAQFVVDMDRTKKTEAHCPVCRERCWLYAERGYILIAVE